ncbi:ABC transporter permease [bacterium]|nr:ABC transporter permease [bacterium]
MNSLAKFGSFILFNIKVIKELPFIFKRRYYFLRVCKKIGLDSLWLIIITSIFTGFVTALQAIYQTKGRIPLSYLGVLVEKSVVIELAPVLTALVLTGKIGAALTAEIGTMKVTEQVDALESMAISPYNFIYMPRIVAGAFMVPILTIISMLVGILSGFFFSVLKYNISFYTFFSNMQNYFAMSDIYGGLIKALAFGITITSIACYQGHKTGNGSEGVGISTTNTVVYSSIMILVLDFFVAWILFGI